MNNDRYVGMLSRFGRYHVECAPREQRYKRVRFILASMPEAQKCCDACGARLTNCRNVVENT